MRSLDIGFQTKHDWDNFFVHILILWISCIKCLNFMFGDIVYTLFTRESLRGTIVANLRGMFFIAINVWHYRWVLLRQTKEMTTHKRKQWITKVGVSILFLSQHFKRYIEMHDSKWARAFVNHNTKSLLWIMQFFCIRILTIIVSWSWDPNRRIITPAYECVVCIFC